MERIMRWWLVALAAAAILVAPHGSAMDLRNPPGPPRGFCVFVGDPPAESRITPSSCGPPSRMNAAMFGLDKEGNLVACMRDHCWIQIVIVYHGPPPSTNGSDFLP